MSSPYRTPFEPPTRKAEPRIRYGRRPSRPLARLGGAAVLALVAWLAFGDDDELEAVPGRDGATMIGPVDVDAVPDSAWASSQLTIGPGCEWIVVGAGFMPWGAGVSIVEIEAPTLNEAVGLPGEHGVKNSAWGLLAWHWDRGLVKTAAELEQLLSAELGKRGCPPDSPAVRGLLGWARPRIAGWVRERKEAIG